MDIAKFFNGVLEGHEPALLMYGRRVEVLANNLANADTPNFKARDLNFAGIMADIFAPPMDMGATDVLPRVHPHRRSTDSDRRDDHLLLTRCQRPKDDRLRSDH